jgi:putative transposase
VGIGSCVYIIPTVFCVNGLLVKLAEMADKEIPASANFLHHLKTEFSFRVKAIQIDGGSEFKDQFEAACRSRELALFVNPPRCPEINGGVERANRTSREEFYEVEDLALVTEELNRQLEEWEHAYNNVRPHQPLDCLTPNEYYRRWKKIPKSQVSLMP